MTLAIGLVLFCVDRALKCFCFKSAIINSGFVAGSGVVVIISMLLLEVLTNRFHIGKTTRWDVFIVVGGISNLIDIILFGGVVDYIKLFNFQLNFSDILITVGLGLLIFEIWKKK